MEDASAAFGKGITANKTESLALSGTAYAKDPRFINDVRLVQDEKTIDPATMLRDMKKLQVVLHAPSDNLIRAAIRRTAHAIAPSGCVPSRPAP